MRTPPMSKAFSRWFIRNDFNADPAPSLPLTGSAVCNADGMRSFLLAILCVLGAVAHAETPACSPLTSPPLNEFDQLTDADGTSISYEDVVGSWFVENRFDLVTCPNGSAQCL